MNKFKYGWKAPISRPEGIRNYRDVKPMDAVLPISVDLRPKDAPIYDQGQVGSCVGNATCGAIQFIQPELTPSRLFAYYNARKIEGTTDEDAGCCVHDCIQGVVTNGICSETDWPYIEDNATVTPSNQSYIDAKKDLITEYFAIETIEEIKQCLAAGFPVIYGITLHESFESDEVASTGIVPEPKKHEEILGGHGMELVGYDDSDPDNPIFIDRNSWGTVWGQSGYCKIPQKMVMKWGSDFWTIRGDTQVKG